MENEITNIVELYVTLEIKLGNLPTQYSLVMALAQLQESRLWFLGGVRELGEDTQMRLPIPPPDSL